MTIELYEKVKSTLSKYGYSFTKDYLLTNSMTYKPYIIKEEDKIIITYYGIGFEVVAEIVIEKLACRIDIVDLNVHEIIYRNNE